jgi:hypothetical protein
MHNEGSGETWVAQGPWSVWGIRLAAVLSVALAVSLGWSWIELFYRGVAVNTQMSFVSSDQPYMPLHTIAKPIIGVHYFGDFQLPLGYATNIIRHSISPYGTDIYPPISQFLFIPFTFLPLREAAFIYLLLSAVVFLLPLWLLLSPLKVEYRIMFLTPVAVLTSPFISFLDRGNDIGIVVGLVAWATWAWRSDRLVLCGTFLAAAIALKVYPAGLLVVPLALRRYRFATIVAATAAFANLLALVVIPGGYLQNLRGFISAQGIKTAPSNQLFSWSLYSIIPKTAGLLIGPSAVSQLLAPRGLITWLPAILYLGGLYFVIRRGRVPQWCWGPLSLATIQLLDPVSFVYTTAWAPVAAIWFAWGYLVDTRVHPPSGGDATEWVALRIMVICALTATVAPSVIPISGAGGFETLGAQYLSPLILLVTLCTAVVISIWPSARESVSDYGPSDIAQSTQVSH